MGTTNAESILPLNETKKISTTQLWGEQAQSRGLSENSVGIDMLLDIVIKYLILILEDPTESNAQLYENGDSLLETADTLILGYPFYGLKTDLTQAEIEHGLDDANTLINLLKENPDDTSLDEDTRFELNATALAVIEELTNGE